MIVMVENKITISRKIKEARILANLSQEDLAEKLKLDRQGISRMESGQRKIDVSELKTIADITGQSLSFFYGEEGNHKNYRRIVVGEGVRDLSDLSEDDLKLVDELVKKLRERYFGKK